MSQKAVDEIKSLVKRFQPLFELEKELERIGNLEQAKKEAECLKDKALVDLKESEEKRELSGDLLKRSITEIDSAKKLAASIVNDANYQAGKIISSAESEAGLIVSKANNFKSQIDDDYKSKKSEISKINSEIIESSKKLDFLNKQIEETKAKISAFVRS